MKNTDDFFYIQRIKAGNVRAFTVIVDRYQKMILTIVMRIIDKKEDAEDIMQEIFIKVYKSINQFREESEFSTWLYRIAYNTTLSELRKRKLPTVSIDDNPMICELEPVPEDIENHAIEEKLQYLDRALKQLAPDEIFLISLYYMDNRSIEDISKISAISVSNVKVKLHRIRKKITVEINKLMQNGNK
jgi:RNA polymerase sigma-70 factor (ECF subfamily)